MFSIKKAYRRYFWNNDWDKIGFLKGLSKPDKNRKPFQMQSIECLPFGLATMR